MYVNNSWQVAIARHLYKATVELGEAAQLCVFIICMQHLYLRVLMCVFGYGFVVSVLVIRGVTGKPLLPLEPPLHAQRCFSGSSLSDLYETSDMKDVSVPCEKMSGTFMAV